MKITKNLSGLSKNEIRSTYFSNMKPILNDRAMFADATEEYRSPEEPSAGDTVKLKFRTAKYNVDRVEVVVNGIAYSMKKFMTNTNFDYYIAEFTLGAQRTEYYFHALVGRTSIYYNQAGPYRELNPTYNFVINPGFKTPDWAKGAVIYQIYVDRFRNGDKSNDVVDNEYVYIGEPVHSITDWNEYPATMDVRNFYGGDLQGVLDKMDYLESLGIDAIYFNPLFVSPSNHKYDIQDYDYIDPHFGVIVNDGGEPLPDNARSNDNATKYKKRVTDYANLEASNEFFAKLVEEAHRRNIKVIIDGVFNHCGSFNKWLDRERIYEGSEGFDKGAYVDKESPYHDFFKFQDDYAWPYNQSYLGWWGHDTLPKLNYEGSKKLEDYILGIAKKWVSPPYNVDGWRLDVAADLGFSPEYNHIFWRKFRNAVKEANPEAIILAENYGDSYSWLQGDQWDTIMNYDAFMEPVTYFLTGMEKHSDSSNDALRGNPNYFISHMRHNMARLGGQPTRISMNELSNHDHSRFLTRTNRVIGRTASKGAEAANYGVNKGIFMEAVVMQMTWPGAPTIYYGDEAGVCGWTDPDNRRSYPWGHEDEQLIDFHREMIRIHKDNPALIRGSYKNIYADYNILAYARFYNDNSVIVIVNNNDGEREISVEAWQAEVLDGDYVEQVMFTMRDGHSCDIVRHEVPCGILTVKLPEYSSAVFVKKKKN